MRPGLQIGFCEPTYRSNACFCTEADYNSGCRNRRRSLSQESDALWKGDEPEYFAVVEACGDYEYEGRLYIDSEPHFLAVASPKEDAKAAGCPFIVINAIEVDESGMRKQILAWDDVDKGDSLMENESLVMGTFKLSSIAQAYQKADASQQNGGAYEVLTNNCAGLVVSLASKLDIEINSRVTTFVARRLLEENTNSLVDSIKSSIHYLSLFKDRHLLRSNSVTDEELIDLVVEKHVT